MESVDLGLSVKWATCNIGASKTEEYGNYYVWGEVETKSEYSWDTYKHYNGSKDSLTKYCINSGYGEVDGKTTLEKSDDVASTTLGGNWRMPTAEEWTELRENCTWVWTKINGMYGYKVISTNGNFIFLPAASYCDDSGFVDIGSGGLGLYLSSSLNSDFPFFAWYVYFNSNKVGSSNYERYYGRLVRPVLTE